MVFLFLDFLKDVQLEILIGYERLMFYISITFSPLSRLILQATSALTMEDYITSSLPFHRMGSQEHPIPSRKPPLTESSQPSPPATSFSLLVNLIILLLLFKCRKKEKSLLFQC